MLVDAHIHIGRENSDWAVRPVKEILMEYKNRGIGGVRDGGDARKMGIPVREAAKELGMIYKTPIMAFTGKGGYGGFLGAEYEGISEIREGFLNLQQEHPDFTKAICSGILLSSSYGTMMPGGLTLQELQYLVDISHDHGLKVMGHCIGEEAVENALHTGVDSIEHGFLATAEQFQRMKEQDVIWVPTIAAFANELFRNPANPPEKEYALTKYVEGHLERIALAHSMGVKIGLGSDAGPKYNDHGQGLLDEINYFQKAGVPKTEALKMCEKTGQELLEW